METEAIAALIGALIGGAMTIVGNIAHERWQEGRRAEHVSRAIAGEISALADIVRRRGYLAGIRAAEEAARNGTPWLMKARITKGYFPVVEASLDHIGTLPAELPTLIPRFLTLAKSALEDIQAIEGGFWDELEPPELCQRFGELGDVLEAALTTAADVIAVVERQYGSSPTTTPVGHSRAPSQ